MMILIYSLVIVAVVAIWMNVTAKDEMLWVVRKVMLKSDGDTPKHWILNPFLCGVCGTFWLALIAVLINAFLINHMPNEMAIISGLLAYLASTVYFKYINN